MRKTVLFLCLGAAITLSGCVTTKTYQDALVESEARRAKAEGLSADLSQEKSATARLKAELEASEKEISALKAKIEELRDKGIMTSKEIDELRDERNRLLSSDKAKGEEIVQAKSAIEKEASASKGLALKLEESSKKEEALAEKIEGLTKEKEELSARIAELQASLDGKEKEREYQAREIERLKVKSGEISTEKERELQRVKGAYEDLIKEMKQEIEKGDIKITQAVDRLSVNLVEKILFDSGESELKPEGLKIIKRVGDILKGIADKQIRVEGHTDNVQIGAKIRKKYPSNWELSTARATNVVRYLQDKVGISSKNLSAAGFAENKPVASNDTQEGKAQNRRIEIVLLPLDVDRVLEELKK